MKCMGAGFRLPEPRKPRQMLDSVGRGSRKSLRRLHMIVAERAEASAMIMGRG